MLKYLLLCSVCSLAMATARAQNVPPAFEKVKAMGGIEEYKLKSNDLTILLMEDRSAPVVTVMVTYLVGSRNEVTGTTGATHLLEHLMFKGTDKYNRADGTGMDAMLQNRGALLNATTWLDRTNYYENLPNEHLELALDIEADRMRNLWLRDEDRIPEMTVVRNEFEIGENSPFGSLNKEIWATAIQAHPYHHSTIGWRSDIENVPIEKLRDFYDTFYWPNNATLTVIGDFNKADAFRLIEKYYGVIPPSPNPIPQIYTEEPQQRGPRRVIVKRTAQLGAVGIAHKVPEGAHSDYYPLNVLSSILSGGNSSRFNRSLVDAGLATSTFTFYSRFRDPSIFTPYVFLAPGATHQQVEDVMIEEFRKVKEDGVTQAEVDRAINSLSAQIAYSRDGSFSIASSLNEAIAMGDWTVYVSEPENLKKVTTADVQRVAQAYFLEDMSTTGWFIAQVPGNPESVPAPRYREMPDTRLYYRDPDGDDHFDSEFGSLPFAPAASTSISKNITDRKVQDVRVLTMKTAVNDVVTVRGSLVGGSVLNSNDNSMIAQVTARMLDKGTVKQDKYAIAEKLEDVGAQLSFGSDANYVTFSGRFLKKDLNLVMNLLAEQLKEPAFDEEELTRIKLQFEGQLRQALDNPNNVASANMSRILYPAGHPNYTTPVPQMMEDIKKITTDDLKAFHRKNYGPKSMVLVAVGDIEARAVQNAVNTAFRGWRGGLELPKNNLKANMGAVADTTVFMADKTSVTYRIGVPTGVDRLHPDFLPLYIGTYILGGNFSARLMSTVRDEEGLTYGISSFHTGDLHADGSWILQASFAPSLLGQGEESAMHQLRKWIAEGVTADELEAKKSTISGMYKVQLATTGGMAGRILNFVQEGRNISYMDQYVNDINKLTLDQVNSVIKKYLNPDQVVILRAGTVE